VPVLEVRDLALHFPVRKGLLRRELGRVRAVDGVSLDLLPGRTLALVGESGCGKTTVGKAILQLIAPTAGRILLDGRALRARSRTDLQAMRRAVQMVFQDPFASLNPRMRIGDIIEEGMLSLGVEPDEGARRRSVDALLERIGLGAAARWRHPHEFSGGQRQRIAIARALAVTPRVLICDEPTSALDVSVQAQLLNLMRELQQEHGLAYLFITHNLAVVDYLADEVAVMYLGRIVEQGPVGQLLRAPAHPYTRLLLAAVPQIPAPGEMLQERSVTLPVGVATELPSPLQPPTGCHFHPRCAQAIERCRQVWPQEHRITPEHRVHCHLPLTAG
jgi:peptide/nickel transport system ATP-binding protein